jgi:AraC-like DNA-binding protein
VSPEAKDLNRRLLRARDAMDRAYAEPLDVRAIAAVSHISPAHFSRCFRTVFGETPHRYLQRRRVERSMFLLRETDRSVTDVCSDVGFTSLGTFSRTFREIVGLPYRSWADRRAQLRPDGEHPTAGGGDTIEQFWISHRRGSSPSLTTFQSALAEENTK